MKVAILIPTFNRKDFLKECLREFDNQTYKDFKIIVYDDGSTDGTDKMMGSFPDVTYIRNTENHGVGYARNMLFDYVESLENKPEYLMWQDSDDFPHINRVGYMVKAIEAQEADIAFSDMFFFMHPQKHTRTKTLHKIDITKYTNVQESLNNNMNFATAIFKTKLTKFRFDETLRRNEDGKWLLSLIDDGTKIGYLHTGLYYCRRHPGRLTNGGRF